MVNKDMHKQFPVQLQYEFPFIVTKYALTRAANMLKNNFPSFYGQTFERPLRKDIICRSFARSS